MLDQLIAIFICICCNICAATRVLSIPSQLHLGGLFNVVPAPNTWDRVQAEHQAAFILAINEINNKTDGLYDDLLPGTRLVYAIGSGAGVADAASSAAHFKTAFGGEGVVGVVNALPDEEALVTDAVFVVSKIPQVITTSTSGRYNDLARHPYSSRVVGSVPFQGMVLQSLMCSYFKAQKVVLIMTADFDGGVLSQEFSDQTYCEDFNYLATLSIKSGATDFSRAIDKALNLGARYFVFFTPVKQTAGFIEQAYPTGLFEDGAVLVTTSEGSEGILDCFSPGADVAAMLRNFITVQFWPDFYDGRSPEFASFKSRWQLQKSTVGSHGACDATTDDEGLYYLYRSQHNTSFCTGLDVSVDHSVNPNIPLTYDATVLLATALHFALENGLDVHDARVVPNVLVSNVSITGASGPIEIFAGMPQFSNAGKGNREVGLHFHILNFNVEEYRNQRDPMVIIGYWASDESAFFGCESPTMVGYDCFSPQYWNKYSIASSSPPNDSPPVHFVPLNPAYAALLQALAAITLLLVVAFSVMVIGYRSAKVIKSSQPALLYCILLGGLIAAGRIFSGAVEKSDVACASEFWLGHLAYMVMIGSLFVKAWRVHRIVNTKTLRKVKFTAFDALLILGGIVFSTVVYLAISHGVGEPKRVYVSSESKNQVTSEPYCSMKYVHFQTALFAAEFVFLCYVFKICWAIRNVPDTVNESKSISAGMYSCCSL